MRRFGLTGFPLGHSFSAKYFAGKFRDEAITDCEYVNYPLSDISIVRDLFLKDKSLEGLNVTIPDKKSVIQYIDEIDQEASLIGAVNVIKAYREGNQVKLKGFNTDAYGFAVSLPDDIKKRVGKVLVLGSGGAAAAIIHALSMSGFSPLVVSRSGLPGTIAYDRLSPQLISEAVMIVNATPLGMYPDTEGRPEIDYDSLQPEQLLYDLVYNPLTTSFMKEGAARGCRTMNGLKMLENQADRAWEIWNDSSL